MYLQQVITGEHGLTLQLSEGCNTEVGYPNIGASQTCGLLNSGLFCVLTHSPNQALVYSIATNNSWKPWFIVGLQTLACLKYWVVVMSEPRAKHVPELVSPAAQPESRHRQKRRRETVGI